MLKIRNQKCHIPQRLGGSQRQVQPLHFLLRCQEMTIALPESQLSLPLICPPAHAVHVASIDCRILQLGQIHRGILEDRRVGEIEVVVDIDMSVPDGNCQPARAAENYAMERERTS